MRHALAADWLLLRSRHIVWVIVIVAVGVATFFAAQTISELAPATDAQRAQAQEAYQADLQWWEANHEELAELCIDDGGSPEQCAVPRPQADQYLPWQASFPWTVRMVLLIAAALMAMAMFTAGATFVGSEFASGAMATWHSHVPSRSVLVGSKLVTIGYVSAAVAVTVFTTAVVTVAVAAWAWHVPADPAEVGVAALSGLRGTVLVVLSGLLGAATAFLTRRATIAIGLALGYVAVNRLVASYEVATGVTSVLDVVTQAQAWVSGGMTLTLWAASGPQEVYLPAYVGVASWGLITTVMVLLSFIVHRRRDLA